MKRRMERRSKALKPGIYGERKPAMGKGRSLQKALEIICKKYNINPKRLLFEEQEKDAFEVTSESGKYWISEGTEFRKVSTRGLHEFLLKKRFGEKAVKEYNELVVQPKEKKFIKKKPVEKKGKIFIKRGTHQITVAGKIIKVTVGGIKALAGASKTAVATIIIFVPQGREKNVPLYSIVKHFAEAPRGRDIFYLIYDFAKEKRSTTREHTATGLSKELITIYKQFKF